MGNSNELVASYLSNFGNLLDGALSADEKLKFFANNIRENLQRNVTVIYLPTVESGFILADLKAWVITAILDHGPNSFNKWEPLLHGVMVRVNEIASWATCEQLETWNGNVWPDLLPLKLGSSLKQPVQIEERKRRLAMRGIHVEDPVSFVSVNQTDLRNCVGAVIEDELLRAIEESKIKPSCVAGMANDVARHVRANPTWPDVELWRASIQDIDDLGAMFGCLERVPESQANGAAVIPLVFDSRNVVLAEFAHKWTLAANKGVSKDDIVRGNFRLATEWRSNELALLDHAKAGKFSSLAMPLPNDISLALLRAITAQEAVQFLTNKGFSASIVTPAHVSTPPLKQENGEPIAPPKQRIQTHRERLVAAAIDLGFELNNLPKYQNGAPSAKAKIKARMGPPYTDIGSTVFQNTWVSMTKAGQIVNTNKL
jgi:hypothetical protein